MMPNNQEKLNRLIECIFTVHQDGGIDCETCSTQFECLVELVARGAKLGELLPAVEQHLDCCPDCKEEFDALTAIVIAELHGELSSGANTTGS